MHISGRVLYWTACACLLVLGVLYTTALPWTEYADMWEQVAAIRALAGNLLHPDNPLLELPGDTSPRFTPYTLFWGAVAASSGANVHVLIVLMAIGNLLLFVTGLYRLIRWRYHQTVLALILLGVMLTCWGRGWSQSNAYSLFAFFYTLPFLSTFAYGLAFHALASLQEFLEVRRMHCLLSYGALSLICFVSHPITAAFELWASVALLAADKKFRYIPLEMIIWVACIAAAVAWPYFDYWHVLTRGSTETWFSASGESNSWVRLGPALIGIPAALWLAIRKNMSFTLIGFLGCAGVYFASQALNIAIGYRFLLYTAVFLHLALAILFAEEWAHRRHLTAIMALLAVLLLWAAPYRWRDVNVMARHLFAATSSRTSEAGITSQLERLDRQHPLHRGEVVLAEPEYGLIVPALTDAKVVAHIHGNPLLVIPLASRCANVDTFLHYSVTREWRQEMLERYGIDHILLNSDSLRTQRGNLDRDLPRLATLCGQSGDFILYECIPPSAVTE